MMPVFKKLKKVHFNLNEFKNCCSPRKNEVLYLNVFRSSRYDNEEYVSYVITLNGKQHKDSHTDKYQYAIKDLMYTGNHRSQDEFMKEVQLAFDHFNKQLISKYKEDLQVQYNDLSELEMKKSYLKTMEKNGGAIIIQGSSIIFHPYMISIKTLARLVRTLACSKK